MTIIKGGVCTPKGYRASGVSAGIRKEAVKKDCALIVSDAPAAVAGMFTKNVMKSPPVYWDIQVREGGRARAVFINSSIANAATSQLGHDDVAATLVALSAATDISKEEICVCSTGVIGMRLPMDRIRDGVAQCAAALSDTGSLDAAEAIMTTDTVPKEFAAEIALPSGTVRLGAMAKGSGMISPDMATMIVIITSDATMEAPTLQEALRLAVDRSFNRISIDNDMSTSDTVLLFANGESGCAPIEANTPEFETFCEGLATFCEEVAKAIVKDGEGATKFVEIQVRGTGNDEEAKTIARAIAHSQLCKTAFFGQDPNWGRFVCAAGYAGVEFDPAVLRLWVGDVQLVEAGVAAAYEEADAAAVMQQPAFVVALEVGAGPGEAVFWTSDLSHEYVSINADYRS